ncbi:MAG: hypothetical protein WA021_05485 [Minisyncoccia bacterium]
MSQKTIAIAAAEDFFARNIFVTDFWQTFTKANADAEIVLIVAPDKKERFSQLCAGNNISVETFAPARQSRLEQLVLTMARSGIRSHTNLWSKMHAYQEGSAGFLSTTLKRLHAFLFGGSVLYKQFLRHCILSFTDSSAAALFEKIHPDVLISLSVTNFDFDVPLLREAKRRSIRTVGMTRSWDSLSSHGLMRVPPDILAVQNIFLKEMAEQYQAIDVAKNPVHVVGIPNYDDLDTAAVESREVFCARHGLDPNKKLVLLCGMGEFFFKREGDFVDIFEQLIENGSIKGPVQVLFSPNPRFKSPLERTKGKKHVHAVQAELRHSQDLVTLLHHVDVAAMGASTIAIDASLVGTPFVCLGFDGTAKRGEVPYWLSVERLYDTYTHFEDLIATGDVSVVKNSDELVQKINRAIGDRSLGADGRKKIVARFVEPLGGAGKRLAEVFSNACI